MLIFVILMELIMKFGWLIALKYCNLKMFLYQILLIYHSLYDSFSDGVKKFIQIQQTFLDFKY